MISRWMPLRWLLAGCTVLLSLPATGQEPIKVGMVIEASGPFKIDPMGRWKAVFVVSGSARIGSIEAGPEETLLVPKPLGATTLTPKTKVTALAYGPGPGN